MAYDGIGITSDILTSNGSGTMASFKTGSASDISSINVQVFTASGTYTPSPNMIYAQVEVVGGGGGGCASPGDMGGAGGGYARKLVTAAQVGASQAVTIGQGGAGGYQNTPGANGGTTSFGSIVSATGGSGTANGVYSSIGGVGQNGDINCTGSSGIVGNNAYVVSGMGGGTFYAGSIFVDQNASIGANGNFPGGGGTTSSVANPSAGGGNGAPGVCIITEYIG